MSTTCPWPAPDPSRPTLPPAPRPNVKPHLATSGQPIRQALPVSEWWDVKS